MRSLMKIATGLLLLAFVLIGISYSMLKAYGTTSPDQRGRPRAGRRDPARSTPWPIRSTSTALST
jgi:hypothetical protein